MNDMKIIITGINIDEAELLKNIIAKNDDLSVIPHCSTDKEYIDKYDGFTYYIDINSLYLSYKNNSLVTIVTNNNVSTAITLDDFYNNDICVVSPKEFNMISDSFISTNNILVIWLDSKINNMPKADMIELNYLQERIMNINNYLYFLDASINEISNIIIQYIYGNEDTKTSIIEQYS